MEVSCRSEFTHPVSQSWRKNNLPKCRYIGFSSSLLRQSASTDGIRPIHSSRFSRLAVARDRYSERPCRRECLWIHAKSKRVSRILGLVNAVMASTVDHAQTDRRTLADSKGTNTVTASLCTRLVGRRTLAVRQFSLCGWEAASSQGRQAHWRGKLAASDRLFRVPAAKSR